MITSLKHTCAGMARPMELLAPAGGMEQLECAVHFGADAVYLAGKRFGMRRRASNFDEIYSISMNAAMRVSSCPASLCE